MNCSLADKSGVVTVMCVWAAPALGCPPPPTNVLAEMTDFMLIHIYPALITLREVRSEHPDFHAKGWHVPTPVQCCLTLLAGTGTGTVPTATAPGTGR